MTMISDVGAPFSQTQSEHRLDDGLASAQTQEGACEAGGADDDDDDHRRGPRRLVETIGEVQPCQLSISQGHDERSESPDAGRLGCRGDAEEDRPENEEDQRQRRDGVAQGVLDAFGKGNQRELRCGDGRPDFRIDGAADRDVDHVDDAQRHARNNAGHEELSGGHRRLVGHHDEHDARGNEDPETPACRDHSHGDFPLVAVADQHRPDEQPHRDDRGADDARAGRKDDADGDHGEPHAAPDRTEQDAQGLEEFIRHARHRQEVSHQDEERDGHKDEVVHGPVDPLHKNTEELRSDEGETEDDADAGKDKGQGMPQK